MKCPYLGRAETLSLSLSLSLSPLLPLFPSLHIADTRTDKRNITTPSPNLFTSYELTQTQTPTVHL